MLAPIRPASSTGTECVRVFVRVDSAAKTVSVGDPSNAQNDSGTSYTFDGVFGPTSTQEDVFGMVGSQVAGACLEGYNGSIYVYGQTGTGKTFTMLGPPRGRGLTSRIIESIFHELKTKQSGSEGTFSYMCKISCVEIYREALTDLFDPTGQQLQLRDDIRRGVYVEGLSEHTVYDSKEAELIVRRALVKRHVGSTMMNEQSSRSHCVVMLRVATKLSQKGGVTQTKEASLNLVDLAGSERQPSGSHNNRSSSGMESQARVKEAGAINKSLSVLTSVIYSLSKQSTFTHFRDSKLTFLLRDSLGGNSITSIIATVSPLAANFGETLSTIKFAARAKRIKCQAVLNESLTGTVESLTAELEAARRQLAALTAGQTQLRVSPGVPDGGTGAFATRGGVGSPSSADDGDGQRAKSGEASSALRRRIISLQILLAGSLARERELEEVKTKQQKWAVYWEETAKSLQAFEDAGSSLTRLVAKDKAGDNGGDDAEEVDDDREEEIRLLRTLVENHPERARRELLELELQQQLEENAALKREAREMRQEHEEQMRAERRRRQSTESTATISAMDGLSRTLRSGILPGRQSGQAVASAVGGATGLRFITDSVSDGSPQGGSEFTESDAESIDVAVHLGDTGGGPLSDDDDEKQSGVGEEARGSMESVQIRHLKREIRMLLADIEELRGRCQFAEIPRQETPAPIEGVQEDGYGDLGVAPSPEYRFGEIIQASPGLSPHGTPAVLRTRKADQSPEASPPQSWSQLVPISNERVSSDGDDEEEEATGAVKIDSELVREVASLCRDVDALVEKIRQADNALVLRSTPVMEVHGDHGGVVGEQGDDFEEIDVEKSLKKSPWVIDGDGMSSKGSGTNSPMRQLAQSASMSRLMRYTAATVMSGQGGVRDNASKLAGLSSIKSTPHLSSLLDKRRRGPPPASSKEQTRTLSKNANTASALLRNKSTRSLHAISELELSVFDERTGYMVTTASPRTAAIAGSASSAALPTMEEILGEDGDEEEEALLRSTKETLKKLLIELELVSNAYQQLSDDFQKLLEDYESKVAECEFFQSQWNQLLRGKERLQQRGLVAVGRLDGWLAKASLSGSFPIIAIVTVF
ncbi:Kinesin-II 85 kDa subunit, putative [Perkinsus marinus ATCC 50983]|uniref:Kinesin-II 85 kDa subunit, putative n=1 Tax=Perkinsus marinus (strain ATCC 50983 / TXsc) TaxID=423536 RepID=C5L6A7_PERM5|nr:Kinesin-II 85 kDa subunit, putative [Perkinsus marinus ATCC 50983]EER07734.1 Kinesin-II 85 kDa subunit, putative [Perkinsus marinus ATCC 50983]|eukprot:XP_002775918.1 Kinesin-II 85 kDa subunit, putative [Perkinsus marinus ATCC 50983]